jgi:hypothetical protein
VLLTPPSAVTFPPLSLAVRQHPVKVAQGEWTSVIGVMESTFTRHMTVPDGTVIQPTGKAFKIKMATIGRWNAAGVMTQGISILEQSNLHDTARSRKVSGRRRKMVSPAFRLDRHCGGFGNL